MRLILVRHGESEHNRLRIHNANDTPLSELGREQARRTALRLLEERIDVAYTSTLPRAIETAETILAYHPHVHLVQDARIREKDNGVLAGKPYGIRSELARQHGVLEEEYVPEQGESLAMACARTQEFTRELLALPYRTHVLIVSHGGPLGTILSTVAKEREQQPLSNTGLTIVDVNEQRQGRLYIFNSTDHL